MLFFGCAAMSKSIRPIQTGTFHSTATAWLLASILCSCAGLFNTIPDREEYEYKDIDSSSYRLELFKGDISGICRIIGKTGDTLESIRWTRRDSVQRTPFWKSVRYYQRDTLFLGELPKREMDACDRDVRKRKRGIEDYAKVVERSDKDLAETYYRFSKVHRFGGQVEFRISVLPSGRVGRIYLLTNTSGDHDFALELLRIVNNLKFPPIESGCREEIIIPTHFLP